MTKRRLSVHLLTVLLFLSVLRVPGSLAMQEATPIASPVADVIEHLHINGPWKYNLSDIYQEPAVTAAVEKLVIEHALPSAG